MNGGEAAAPIIAAVLGQPRRRAEVVWDDVLIAAFEIGALVGGYKLVKRATGSEATSVIAAIIAARGAGAVVGEIIDRALDRALARANEKKTEVGATPQPAATPSTTTNTAPTPPRRVIGVDAQRRPIYETP